MPTTLGTEIWSAVGQHRDLHELLAALLDLLARPARVRAIVVRRFDVDAGALETVDQKSADEAAAISIPASIIPRDILEPFMRWTRAHQSIPGESRSALAAELLPLIASNVEAPFVCVPFATEDESSPIAGAVVLILAPGKQRPNEALLRELSNAMAVAVRNDHGWRELRARAEALAADNRALLNRLERQDISDSIVGAEAGLKHVMERVEQVARSDVPILIFGETGSGKEVVARAIHTRSMRVSGPILRVNCGAIPPDLIDSELFGHERGSFTGATSTRKGWFERADQGTLFLDEVGELPLAAQVRMLRILQDGTFERVGGHRTSTVDVRVIAATNRDLHSMVSDGTFREDLWYRLSVFPIHLPALRDRRADIPSFAIQFAARAGKRLAGQPLVPSAHDIELLVAYAWPGNVRELAAVIERAAILGDGKRLEVAQALGARQPLRKRSVQPFGDGERIPEGSTSIAIADADGGADALLASDAGITTATASSTSSSASLDDAMRGHIESALRASHGRIEGPFGAARKLKINPYTLRSRMRKLGVDWRMFRSNGD